MRPGAAAGFDLNLFPTMLPAAERRSCGENGSRNAAREEKDQWRSILSAVFFRLSRQFVDQFGNRNDFFDAAGVDAAGNNSGG